MPPLLPNNSLRMQTVVKRSGPKRENHRQGKPFCTPGSFHGARTARITRGRLPTFARHIFTRHNIALLILTLLIGACGDSRTPPEDAGPDISTLTAIPGGTCGLPTENTTENTGENPDDETQIHALIEAEGEFTAAGDIGPLMALWADESRVINAKNTPDDADDNQIWRGKDAIRHRYLNVVFPSAPEFITTPMLHITVDGDNARAQGTTQLSGEVSPNGDLWHIRRIDGCWQIVELTYNLEPLEAAP